MRLTTQDLIPLAVLFMGGWGGLLGTVVWWQILDLLNSRRPQDGQIPAAIVTWSDLIKHWPIPVWRHVQEFHRQFPESRLYFWYWAALVWMFTMFLISFVLFATMKQPIGWTT